MLGIFPGHAPMVTKLGIGEVHIVREDDGERVTDKFAVRSGYLEVSHDQVVVLTEDAVAIDEMKGINPEDIERLQAALTDETDAEKRAELQADLDWLKACDRLLRSV